MSNPTTPFSWQMPTNTDLVTDLPADFEVFGQAVATSMADLLGGTSGQILAKNSNTDMDFVWIANDQGDITGVTAGTGISGGGTSGTVTVTNSMATAITTAGDLIKGTGSGTFDRLGIGTTGQILTVASGAPAWATPAAGASGLTLISVQTFSASSGIDVNNVFTSTYTNYRLVFSNITTSTSIYVSYRERASSTTNATNYKKGQYYRSYTSGTAGSNSGGTEGNLFDLNTDETNTMGATLELQCPATTAYTGFQFSGSTRDQIQIGSGIHANAVAYDGFSLFPYSGTMSGTVSIYGYQKAV
jgi:hypothetical protein